MIAVGIGMFFFGYTLAYYGYNVITGGNDSLWSLTWPGKYRATTRDTGKP